MDTDNALARFHIPLFPKKAPYGVGRVPTKEVLAQMSAPELTRLRDSLKTTEEQNAVAPYEHQAFVRDFVGGQHDTYAAGMNLGETPMLNAMAMGASTIPYTAAKLGGLDRQFSGDLGIGGEGRSDPSLEEMARSYYGIGQGLGDAGRRRLNAMLSRFR